MPYTSVMPPESHEIPRNEAQLVRHLVDSAEIPRGGSRLCPAQRLNVV